MNKKNVALVLIIVCFLTIMAIGVFGNAAVTGIKTNVEKVVFLDSEGNLINENEEGHLILSIQYSKDDVTIEEETTKDGNEISHKFYTITFYAVVMPLTSSYPKLFIELEHELSGVELNKIDDALEWPFPLKEDEEPMGVIYKCMLVVDSTIIQNGSASINTRIDENNNSSKIDVPMLNVNWEYIKSDQEIIDDSEELE